MARHSDIVNDNTLVDGAEGKSARALGLTFLKVSDPPKEGHEGLPNGDEKRENAARPIRGGSSLFARLRCRRQMCERKLFFGLVCAASRLIESDSDPLMPPIP